MDSGGKEWLHQLTELQLLLGLSLHPDSCRGRCDCDWDNRMLCHAEGDEESPDCGKMDQKHKRLPRQRGCYYTSPHLINERPRKDICSAVYTHTTCNLKVNPWWPPVLSSCFQYSSLCQTGMTVKYNRQSHAECVFKGLDLERGSCQRNGGHHKRSAWPEECLRDTDRRSNRTSQRS